MSEMRDDENRRKTRAEVPKPEPPKLVLCSVLLVWFELVRIGTLLAAGLLGAISLIGVLLCVVHSCMLYLLSGLVS